MSSLRTMGAISYQWAVRCFGLAHVANVKVRALRHAEEAVELAHAHNVSRDDMNKMIDIIYSRPSGQPHQEVGGSILTLMVYCEANGFDLEECALVELKRVLDKDPSIFAKRNAEKVNPHHD